KFRFDATGLVTPLGKTVRKLPVEGATAVTLRTAAETRLPGTPPTPLIFTARDSPGPSRTAVPPVPSRVSSTRWGGRGALLAPAWPYQPTTSKSTFTLP